MTNKKMYNASSPAIAPKSQTTISAIRKRRTKTPGLPLERPEKLTDALVDYTALDDLHAWVNR